jgi:N-acetyl-1-D-myo-inositol-2-amino-2-deoxy-alpha-D-glucopyranoside deacetylase
VRDLEGIRVVAVHAHPDDESLWTGLALAAWARRGSEVTVVTCTLGEEGEVIGDKYADLVAARADILGGYRIAELQRALAALGVNRDAATGVTRPLFLGGVTRWRDSGMVGTPSAEHPRAFLHSGQTAVDQLVGELDRLRPHVVVTYGPDGGYGHPDHIRAHEITHAAVAAVRREGAWSPARILWCVTERELLEQGLDAVASETTGVPDGWRMPEPGELASVPTADVAGRVVGEAVDVAAKRAAMSAHATQLWVADGETGDVIGEARSSAPGSPTVFCLSNRIVQPLLDTESYMVGDDRTAEAEAAGLSRDILDRLDCLLVDRR